MFELITSIMFVILSSVAPVEDCVAMSDVVDSADPYAAMTATYATSATSETCTGETHNWTRGYSTGWINNQPE